jgi:hypothetical protein
MSSGGPNEHPLRLAFSPHPSTDAATEPGSGPRRVTRVMPARNALREARSIIRPGHVTWASTRHRPPSWTEFAGLGGPGLIMGAARGEDPPTRDGGRWRPPGSGTRWPARWFVVGRVSDGVLALASATDSALRASPARTEPRPRTLSGLSGSTCPPTPGGGDLPADNRRSR